MDLAAIAELGRANAIRHPRPLTPQEEHDLRILLGPPDFQAHAA